MLRMSVRLTLAAVALALAVAPAAHAAPGGRTTIVLFAENRGIARIDVNNPGPDHGDEVDRELALSYTLKGPIIGVTYSQAVIVAYNPEAKIDIRRVDTQKKLPGGAIFTTGVTRLPIGTVPQPGWTDTYAVVGGTGKYAGARGTEKLTLLADGTTFRTVITLL